METTRKSAADLVPGDVVDMGNGYTDKVVSVRGLPLGEWYMNEAPFEAVHVSYESGYGGISRPDRERVVVLEAEGAFAA